MSGVGLRCSNCGSSQPAPGECQTCGVGDVDYFCSNHKPGRWLDGPICPACGARLGGEEPPEQVVIPRSSGSAHQVPRLPGAAMRTVAALERRAETHELLLRALLTHLAITNPETFGTVIGRIVQSKSVPDDVAREVTVLVEEIADSLNR